MTFTTRHRAAAILKDGGWTLPTPPVVWSPRMTRCAGLFVLEKDSRDLWRPEIRLSIPLLRRRDWPWPLEVCGMRCHDPETVERRILEHELIHYALWAQGLAWGHTEAFRRLAFERFGHQAITHGIGDEQS